MTTDNIFTLSNSLAMLSWLALIIVPNHKWTVRILTGVVVTLFALVYSSLVFTSLSPDHLADFSSLKGVMQLFSNEKAVLAGWIHYLAFDLMTAMYIVRNARRLQINRWILLPCLLFTFMFGPFGLLMYFVARVLKTRTYFHAFES